jgi:hypothetical protein
MAEDLLLLLLLFGVILSAAKNPRISFEAHDR